MVENEEVQNGGFQEQAGSEELENLKKYMDEMDQELQSTNIGQSYLPRTLTNFLRTFRFYGSDVLILC